MGVYYSDKVKETFNKKVSSSSSRYDTKLRLKVGNNTNIRMIRKEDLLFDDSNSSVHVVQPIEEYRPDLIARLYYGNESYAWVILAANNLNSFFDMVQGLRLIIPSLVSLHGKDGKMVTV